ncbi:S8 family peptidase [Agarilytica rhodophyticola]|uniref:S8 family peptidase n=1 Tax=Agarilytica rhodophyticola TaxID=1737490 RepID=UPI000B342031|nr:S8 family serine peptidase [Agarilytica rhodophyticola]
MNIKVYYFIVFYLLFSSCAIANDENTKVNVVKHYNALKEKTSRGEKVRVITTVKSLEKDHSSPKALHSVFLHARNLFKSDGLKAQKELPRLGVLVFEVDDHALDRLIKSGVFARIEEDIPEPPTLVQSIDHVDADLAHNSGFTGDGQAVAILDTGVELSHPFYSNRLVEEACFSSNTSIATSLCPNGQDVQVGVDAAGDCSSRRITSCDHGTHVAGIAAGANGTMSGVAPNASIVAVQVFSEFPASYSGCKGVRCILSYRSDQLAALEWILNDSTTNNIAAINMSLGGGTYTSACNSDIRANAIEALRDAGIATVISSGNDGKHNSVGAPGCISAAITTGSTFDSRDSISLFSNSSSLVDILAPGSFITSSVVGGRYGVKSGTSMAAPHITGAFAVMRAINPNATVDDIEASLRANGVPILDTENNLTFPRLDLYTSAISFEGAPVASLDEESYSVIVNKETEFTAYSSSDPNNKPLTYIWDFGDGVSSYQTNTGNVQHTYNDTGSYNIILSVTNGNKYSDQDSVAPVTVYDPTIISVIASSLLQ